MKRAISVALFCMSVVGTASAADLLSVYQDALANDPAIREADALRKASREARPQAWAALLPQIQGTANYTRGKTDQTQPFGQNDPATGDVVLFPRTTALHPDTRGWTINLRQNLFSWSNLATFRAAGYQVAQAEADYRAAEQDLISRVAARYFGVLAAQDTVEANQAALDAFNRQLDQANKRFEVGLIAITDVQDTKAARDQAAAAVIAAKRSLATAEEQLREVTGKKYDQLARPGDTMPLKTPEPNVEQQWVDISLDQNAALISSRLQAEQARENVQVAFGGHLPQIDAVVTRGHTQGSGDAAFTDVTGQFSPFAPFPTESHDKTFGLQITVPIFSGGATQSRVRQSQYQWIAAKERVTRTSRATERAARDAYLGVISNMARVEALRQALESSQTSLKATEAGYEVGTRTSVDVLDARRLLVQAQTNYAQSRYDYLQTVIALRQAAGNLDEKTLEEMNSLLTVTTPTAPTDPNAPVTVPPAQQQPQPQR
ncbi:MAG TPA: TolC family outer membrane protein [Steroidobacteraceae bacterium]|nr:TolC family outer membrane protein [Steroidobacteraceae bacterium]